MRLRNLLTAVAVLGLAFGLAFLFFPTQTLAVYGFTLDPQLRDVPRYLGSSFIGLAVINWFARDLTNGSGVRAILIGDLVLSVSGFWVSLLNAMFRPGNGLVWSTVLLYGLMTAAFVYFQVARPGPRTHRTTPLTH